MNCRAIARTSIRVLLFGSCLLVARVVFSVVLQNRIVDGLIIGSLAIAIILVVLIGMGIIAKRLWMISGVIAARVIDRVFASRDGLATNCSDAEERSA